MDLLGRWAGALAMAGGALVTVVLLMTAFSPTTPAWYGLFLGVVLLGFAVPGLYWRTKAATGRLGFATAWLSGLGAVAVAVAAVYLVATGQVSASQQNLPDGPIRFLAIAAGVAWLVGNLGFAVALIRSRELPMLGAWLVLAGAFIPIAMAPLAGDDSPPAVAQALTLLFGLLPIGWFLLGYSAWRRAST